MHITSPAFDPGGEIPAQYANVGAPGGRNVSVPYSWDSPPQGTKSYALALVDHAPVAHEWVHWLVADIPSDATSLPAGASGTSAMPGGAVELTTTYGRVGYGGPNPPRGTGSHPYEATLYALDVPSLGLPPATKIDAFSRAIAGHVLGQASVTGYVGR